MKCVRTAQEWVDVKAEGTCQKGDDICSIWEYKNEMWKCDFTSLSEKERREVMEICNVAEGGNI